MTGHFVSFLFSRIRHMHALFCLIPMFDQFGRNCSNVDKMTSGVFHVLEPKSLFPPQNYIKSFVGFYE